MNSASKVISLSMRLNFGASRIQSVSENGKDNKERRKPKDKIYCKILR